ncbi:DUF805 domain-containing protein [Streptomyces sp. SCSIO 30461]|uniref:DUF805 domain-containing protein n=1 Tax=Streptomyces sp. SCSIO 30461 TaxID=3118085 RepID=UPI0030D62145
MHWYLDVLKKYAVFSGRARRQEFWMFTLINVIVQLVLMGLDYGVLGLGILGPIYVLLTFLPSLGVTVRRLHDTGRSGWFVLLGIIPLVGPIIVLVFMAGEGKPEANEYGENPKLATA